EGQATVLRFLGGTADDYDLIVAESTGGLDAHWKRWILDRMEDPREVLDLASGTGILSFLMLDRFPDCHVTGVDLQEAYQAVAIGRSRQRGLTMRTTWHRSAVEDIELPEGHYDHIVSCYLPKYADRVVLAERVMRWAAPGGRIILHDFAHPTDPKVERVLRERYERWIEKMRVERPYWLPCFEGLYDFVRTSPWTEDLPPLLEAQGFEDVEVTRVHRGCAAFVTGRKPL
ncbi:MAG: methyltransferase domain-containing protein, partial [Planctomycetota bacterium]|nr:methyltransferase domain-containing protein [Planctomycetota bacterium]